MPKRPPAPLAAWAVLSLPLLALVAGLYLCLGAEAAVEAHFLAWRAANPAAVQWLKFYTDWGNPAFYLAFAAMLGLGLKRRRPELVASALGYLAAQLLFSLALEQLLKISIGRPRPRVGGPFVPWSLDAGHQSMPSGHTTEFTLQAACLAFLSRGLAWPLLLGLALALMGASRVMLGWHHPSDLLAGWALGSLGGFCARPLAARMEPWLARRLSPTVNHKGSPPCP